MGGVALGAAERVLDAAWSGLGGLVLGVFAAPGLLAVGAPFSDTSRYPIGIAGSVVLWLVIGLVAARPATHAARWRCGPTTGATTGGWPSASAGATVALAIARVYLGRALI